MLLRSGRIISTSKSPSTIEPHTIEILERKIEDLRVIVEQLAVYVHQIQRDHPRADGNKAGPVQPNQLVATSKSPTL